ncbi:MAG: hypothetical protein FWG81_10655 [Betaproteobacteria bacterium]|nr:hypothetical protein [Betaproteobacteria bacterium]
MICLRTHLPVVKAIATGGALLALCLLFSVVPALGSGEALAAQPTDKSLIAFASEAELDAWLQERKKLYEKHLQESRSRLTPQVWTR